jgi:hypothetical protein
MPTPALVDPLALSDRTDGRGNREKFSHQRRGAKRSNDVSRHEPADGNDAAEWPDNPAEASTFG